MFAAFGSRPCRRVPAMLAAGLILLAPLAACTDRADPEGTPRKVAREIDRTLAAIAGNEVARDPELATRLGLPEAAAGYPYNRYLSDRSQAAYERARLLRLETRDLLVRITRPARGSALARHLDTVIAAHETAETLFMAGHGTTALSASYPYVADHTRGAWIDVPDLLTRFHPLNTPADARAFVDRMSQLAGAIEDDRRRMDAEAQAGIVPPAPILRRMERAVAAMSATGPGSRMMTGRLETLLPSIPGLEAAERAQLLQDARQIDADSIRPAYAAFAESLARLTDTAPELPGVWQLPDGQAYYAASLRAYTGNTASPSGLHETGKREVTARLAELDRTLAEIGLGEGTVGERLTILAEQDGQLYPDTDEGRAALIEQLSSHAARASAVLNSQFDIAPPGPVAIRALPAAFPGFTPPAAYVPARADGSAPARIDLDLTRMENWPDYKLAALAFHEILPGHHLEGTVTLREAELPLARRLIWNLAYGEGWASYAETLADELGLYSEDPLSRIGYLQSMLLRAACVVADTGIHNERWSRDQAIAYLTETAGLPRLAAADAVDRFTVRPGYGAANWLGRARFMDLRERAIRVLGPRFDPKAFHRVILTGGPRPLSMVDDDITRWYTAQVEE